ncbi:MAG: patatin-like phospholipase family protein [Gemmatimonadaceae bacterium]
MDNQTTFAAITPAEDKYLPDPKRTGGLCLALSGGGFRATLFHLGSIRRLNELGLLDSFQSISSVSGGSIMALCLADAMIRIPPDTGRPLQNFEELASKVREITSSSLRRTVMLRKLLPWNWLRSLAELVAIELGDRVTGSSLADLPGYPRFIFCATDMAFGSDWVYEKTRAGNYQAGYKESGLNTITLAHAAAASGCFPPFFRPMNSGVKASELQPPREEGSDADACRKRIRLTDGGVYDNMGLEPLWKNAETLMVSDAGGVFEFSRGRGTISDIRRYTDIIGNQARALRKRWLISGFINGAGPGGLPGLTGTYWSTTSDRTRYDPDDKQGYSAEIANLIARIRTDLDAFSRGEQAVLENHGYLMCDVAIKIHLPTLYASAPPLNIPFKDWMDETKVRSAIRDSAKQHLLG